MNWHYGESSRARIKDVAGILCDATALHQPSGNVGVQSLEVTLTHLRTLL